MQFKTKKEAISSITESTHVAGGRQYKLYGTYLGTNYITKKPERLYSSSRQKLVEMIEEFYRKREESGYISTVLTPEQVFDARSAMKALSDARIDITLLECAKREIEREGLTIEQRRMDDEIDEAISLEAKFVSDGQKKMIKELAHEHNGIDNLLQPPRKELEGYAFVVLADGTKEVLSPEGKVLTYQDKVALKERIENGGAGATPPR